MEDTDAVPQRDDEPLLDECQCPSALKCLAVGFLPF